MRGELPVCKRCCFCLPLRYGLITWGYFRLVASILFFIGISTVFYGILRMALYYPSFHYMVYVAMIGFILLLTLTDIVMLIVFVVGGHKKSLKLLKAYYIYSFILLTLTMLMGVASSLYTLFLFRIGEIDLEFHIWLVLMDVAALLAQVFIQAYVLLLLRSEIIKLRSNCQFRFVNNAAESECSMNYERGVANGEGIEDIGERGTYNYFEPKDTCEFIGYVPRNNEG